MKISKYIFLIVLFLFGASIVVYAQTSGKQTIGALGLRVYENKRQIPIEKWYIDQGFTGTPQSTTVKGYPAVKDKNSIYINGVFFNPTNQKLETRVYVVTTSDKTSSAINKAYDIIIKNLKFTDYRAETGLQNFTNENIEQIFRDQKRLHTLTSIAGALETYKQKNGTYPTLISGTYIPGLTSSAWPSWQRFLTLIGVQGTDPINTYAYGCEKAGFDPKTCWIPVSNERPNGAYVCPKNSRVFHYQVSPNGQSYTLYANFEFTDLSWSDINSHIVYINDNRICTTVFNKPVCGDSIVQSDLGEECEPGQLTTKSCTIGRYTGQETYECNASCKFIKKGTCIANEQCGDGVQNGDEQCDYGEEQNGTKCISSTYGIPCTYCDESCKSVQLIGRKCGDGILDSEEVCEGNIGTPTNAVCDIDCAGFTCKSGYVKTGSTCVSQGGGPGQQQEEIAE